MSNGVKSYRDLVVWQKAVSFVIGIYKTTKSFPKEEKYGITNQIRRAAVSVPSNIAEGFGRNSKKDFIRFLYISIGSLFEVQTQLDISNKLGFINENVHNVIIDLPVR